MNTRQIHLNTKGLAVWSAACTAVLLLSGGVQASLGMMSLEKLTDRAELIVYGRVASIERTVSERETSAGKLEILTAIVHIRPERVLKGWAVEPIIVKAVENREDSPRFEQDQEVFLFLNRNADDSSFSILGLTQGKVDVVEGRVVREQSSVALFMERLEQLIRMQNTEPGS